MQRVFEIYFAAVVMVFGGVSLLTNQRLYRFLVKPRFELGVFPADQSRLSVCGALPETADGLDDFETSVNSLNWIRKAKVSFTQTLSRRRFHWNNTKSTRKEPNSIPVASTSMLREFSHRSKINAILEKKTRESRKIAPQNDPWIWKYVNHTCRVTDTTVSDHPQ